MKPNKRKGYAYGSMVRSPMASENNMQTSYNPMDPRQQQGGIQPAMGMPKMARGGKTHEQQESPAIERMEKKSKGYMD